MAQDLSIISVSFSENETSKNSRPVWQYDHGLRLQITTKPQLQADQVHFANAYSTEALNYPVSQEADGSQIANVPDLLLAQDKDIFAYVYYEDETSGYTIKVIRIPMNPTVKRQKYGFDIPALGPLNDQKNELERLIRETNDASSRVDALIPKANKATEKANTAAHKIDGMTVKGNTVANTQPAKATISEIDGVKHIEFDLPKGKDGKNGTNGRDGTNGTDGITPDLKVGTVTVSPTPEQGSVTITGPKETPSLNFVLPKSKDGTNGTNGTNGQDGVSPNLTVGTVTSVSSSSPAKVTITGTQAEPKLNFEIPKGKDGTIAGLDPASEDKLGGIMVGAGLAITPEGVLSTTYEEKIKTVAGVAPGEDGNIPLTASNVKARPDTWTPTAEDVGARPVSWTPTADDVGAIPKDLPMNGGRSETYTKTGMYILNPPYDNSWPQIAQPGWLLVLAEGDCIKQYCCEAGESSAYIYGRSKASLDWNAWERFSFGEISYCLNAIDELNAKAPQRKTIKLTLSGWVGEKAPYAQVVSVEGILETDKPVADVNLSGLNDEGAQAALEAWNLVGRMQTGQGNITATCYTEKPAVDLTVDLQIVR